MAAGMADLGVVEMAAEGDMATAAWAVVAEA
jgi:hypothetical protein